MKIPDIEALVERLLRGLRLAPTSRHEVEDAVRASAEDALYRWLQFPAEKQINVVAYVERKAKWRRADALRRLGPQAVLPQPELAPSPEELLERAQEEEAPPAPLPSIRPGLLAPAEEQVLRLRAEHSLAVTAHRLDLDINKVRRLEKSALAKLGKGGTTVAAMRETTTVKNWKTDAATVKSRSGRPVSLKEMGPEQRAEMQRLYVTEPAAKKAAGRCPEVGCAESAHDPVTGRCWAHALRWPKKSRKGRDYQRATDGLIEEEVADVAA